MRSQQQYMFILSEEIITGINETKGEKYVLP